MGKMQKEHAYPELFHKDDKVIESKENIANMFNNTLFKNNTLPVLVQT